MVIPLLPIAAAVGGSVLGGGLVSMFGDKPGASEYHAPYEQYQSQSSDVYHAPYEQYQPTTVYSPQQTVVGPSYQVAIESPDARQTADMQATAKQDTKVNPQYTQPTTYPQQTATGATEGAGIIDTNTIILLAMIGGVAIIGYGLVSGGS